mmetsp:Transcript_54173/g.144417  ORF Transcript_54173/g.144417 Transcript_54173/m.144417 type:complete len:250 (-) Transcript_54173:442-1191(-)
MIRKRAQQLLGTIDSRSTHHRPAVANHQGPAVIQVNLADHDVTDAVPAGQLGVELVVQHARPRMLRESAQNLPSVAWASTNHTPSIPNRKGPLAVRQGDLAEHDVADVVAARQLLPLHLAGPNLDRGPAHKSAADPILTSRSADHNPAFPHRHRPLAVSLGNLADHSIPDVPAGGNLAIHSARVQMPVSGPKPDVDLSCHWARANHRPSVADRQGEAGVLLQVNPAEHDVAGPKATRKLMLHLVEKETC